MQLALRRRKGHSNPQTPASIGAAPAIGPSRVTFPAPAKVNRLSLGGIRVSLEAILLPIDKLNEWRKAEGYPPWSGLLGAEILKGQGAVIDFDAAKLFLLDQNQNRN